MSTVKQHTAHLGGAGHRVSLWPGSAPLLSFHGFTGSGLDFEGLVPHLDVGLEAVDLIGHGASDAPSAVGPYQMEAVVAALAPLLGVGRVLLGYSMGARLALQLAHAHPAQVRAVILVGGTPGLAEPSARRARQAADGALADRIETLTAATFAAEWSKHPVIRSQGRIEARYLIPMMARRRENRPIGLANSLRGMGTGVMRSLWGALPQVTAPTLLLTGGEDAKFTEIARAMLERLPVATHIVIDGAGHCAHLEFPAVAGAAIRRFLASMA